MIGYALESFPTYKKLWRIGRPVYWYKIGAMLGDYMGAYNLAQCCSVGRGTRKDMRAAVFWWRKAAVASYPNALTDLAAAYYNGDGTKKNISKALMLYGNASLGGDRIARRMLNSLNWNSAVRGNTPPGRAVRLRV